MDEDTENGADFLGEETTPKGTRPDHGHEPSSHPASTDGDRPEVEPAVPCMNKFLALRTVNGRGRKKKKRTVITVSHQRQEEHYTVDPPGGN